MDDRPAAGAPRSIGRYELRADHGAGGFATVYRALDPVLDRDVALKVLHPHLARDAVTRERFVREGRALARIRHINCVQVFDAGEADGVAYIAMEFVEGRSLASLIAERGRLPLDEVVHIAAQVAAGLAAVHARNLVHCDVKPANILLEDETARVVLLDLGVSRTLDDPTTTTSGYLAGTPAYMAPEQIVPGGRVGPATDLYQLGATTYALLAGRPPFEGEAAGVMYRIAHLPPPDLRQDAPLMPGEVAALLEETLAKDPGERPSGPLTFAERLRAAASQSAIAPQVAAAAPAVDAPTRPVLEAPTEVIAPPAATAGSVPWRGEALTEVARIDRVGGISPAERAIPGERGHAVVRRRGRTTVVAALAALALLLLAGAGGILALRGDGDGDGDDQAGAVAPAATRTATRPPATPATATVAPPLATATPPPTPTAIRTPLPTPTLVPTTPPTVPPTAAPTAPPTAVRTTPPAATAVPTPPPTPVSTPPPAPPTGQNTSVQLFLPAGYTPSGPTVEVPASGGSLYVVRGDGADGQRLFVFQGTRYIGVDWAQASAAVSNPVVVEFNRFSARYDGAPYGLPSVTITFAWNGVRLFPDACAPGHCD